METYRTAARAVMHLAIVVGGVVSLSAQTPPLEHDFQLRAGRAVTIAGTTLTVRFVGVDQDSRCPTDVQCITAGDAVVALAAAQGRATDRRYALHVIGDPREATHEGYRLVLIGLAPLPLSTRDTSAGDYVVTLRVSRIAPQE